MSLSLNLAQTETQLFNKILRGIVPQLNYAVKNAVPNIKTDVGELVSQLVDKCPEVQSMRGGALQAELGFISPEYFIKALLTIIKESVYIDFKPFKLISNQFVGDFSISVIKANFQDLLSMKDASYKSGDNDVNWLDWLLNSGTDIVVADYRIQYGVFNRKESHSGRAIMVPKGSYSIPAEFAGRPNDNFITRALDIPGIEDVFINIVQKHIQDNLNVI
jgi:hypothetical protein